MNISSHLNLSCIWLIIKNLARRRPPPTSSPRCFSGCLTTVELTSLGIGAILGAGVYIVAGQVAASLAGPSTFISFIIAAFASILSGLSYAEFGARVPKTTGSAYSYSYVAVGEIWAYIIGWNMLLEYMIGTAADASALSTSIENLASNIFGNSSHIFYPFPPILGDHRPDILAFVLTVLVTFLLVIGVKDSSRCTLLCNIINGLIIVFIVITGSFYADFSRWNTYDKFFPYGVGGTLSGAAACFYAFIGFDIIATTGEEASNPSKSIPISIVASLVIVLVGYVCVSIVITTMVPYSELNSRSPLTSAFNKVGLTWAANIISFGSMFGLTSSLIGSLFPLPRIIFSMAKDGLIFSFFTKINTKTEVPINATILPGVLTAFFALFFNLQDLVEMMSIGTLLAYTLVSFCILILRYQPNESKNDPSALSEINYSPYNISTDSIAKDCSNKCDNSVYSFESPTNYIEQEKACVKTYVIAISCCTIIFLCFLATAVIVLFYYESIQQIKLWSICLLTLIGIILIFSLIVLYLQPENEQEVSFKAPCVPALPILAIMCNIFLILKLSVLTWIRFFVWMSLGTLLYIFYGYHHSKLKTT